MDISRLLNDLTPSTPVSSPSHATDASKLRVGKWTDEEERYACALIKHFVAGALPIPTGTSLRSFLAKKLRCSAMRVSTKLSMDALGDMPIPKKLGQKRFFPMEGQSEMQLRYVVRELDQLEAAFLRVENLEPIEEDDEFVGSIETKTSSTSDDESEGPMRVGSWSQEEQVYTCALIDAFLRGAVNAAPGTTLRAFLSERLCCNPMRISKKLATGKMASMSMPKRLGSATYRHQTLDAGSISRTEHQLEQLRLSCFPTAPRYVHHSIHVKPTYNHAQPRYIPSPRNAFHDRLPRPYPADTAFSPLVTGLKRKLPSLTLPAAPYLPSLGEKRIRLPTLSLH